MSVVRYRANHRWMGVGNSELEEMSRNSWLRTRFNVIKREVTRRQRTTDELSADNRGVPIRGGAIKHRDPGPALNGSCTTKEKASLIQVCSPHLTQYKHYYCPP